MNPSRPKTRQKMLGLAVGEKSILAAEVVSSPTRPPGDADSRRPSVSAGEATSTFEATRLAEFVYPGGVTLQQGEALGAALGQFLKENGFSTRHAVVGIPAKWVVVKPKQVPPAEPAVIADTLRLQAEGDFSQGLSDLVYDYAGQASAAESRQVLLMATPRRYVDQVLAVAKAARLDAAAVTPSAASLGWATSRSSGDAMVLLLGTAGAEFTAQCGTAPCALRHLGPAPGAAPGPLFLSELRRTASLLPASPVGASGNGGPGHKVNGKGAPTPRELIVWNGFSTDLAARQAVGDSLGIPVRAGDLASLGVTTTGAAGANGSPANPGHYAPAVALALSGLAGAFGAAARRAAADDEQAVPVDFLHSRLAPPKVRAVDPRVVWGIGVGAAVLVLFLALFIQQNARQAELSAISRELKGRADEIKAAKGDVDMVVFARRWGGSGTPRFLPCMRDLENDMPNDGQTYLTSFDLHEDMKGQIQGKSTSNENALNVAKSLSASGHFAGVDPSISARDAARSGREVAFTIRFIYVGHH